MYCNISSLGELVKKERKIIIDNCVEVKRGPDKNIFYRLTCLYGFCSSIESRQ